MPLHRQHSLWQVKTLDPANRTCRKVGAASRDIEDNISMHLLDGLYSFAVLDHYITVDFTTYQCVLSKQLLPGIGQIELLHRDLPSDFISSHFGPECSCENLVSEADANYRLVRLKHTLHVAREIDDPVIVGPGVMF